MTIKLCSWTDESGAKCNETHTEQGAYCPEHRRQYQNNYRRGITKKNPAAGFGCAFCDRQIKNSSSKVCTICEAVGAHLSTLEPEQARRLYETFSPRRVQYDYPSDEEIALLQGGS